jgi:hypothetical protein
MRVLLTVHKGKTMNDIDTSSWEELISEAMGKNDETWDDVIFERFDGNKSTQFYIGFGAKKGCSFLVWTKNYVYFPVEYDGAEWADSVPRNPCDQTKDHVGS